MKPSPFNLFTHDVFENTLPFLPKSDWVNIASTNKSSFASIFVKDQQYLWRAALKKDFNLNASKVKNPLRFYQLLVQEKSTIKNYLTLYYYFEHFFDTSKFSLNQNKIDFIHTSFQEYVENKELSLQNLFNKIFNIILDDPSGDPIEPAENFDFENPRKLFSQQFEKAFSSLLHAEKKLDCDFFQKMYIADQSNWKNMARLLDSMIRLDTTNLFYSLLYRHPELANADLGYNLNYNLLSNAIVNERLNIVDKLLDLQANPNQVTSFLCNPNPSETDSESTSAYIFPPSSCPSPLVLALNVLEKKLYDLSAVGDITAIIKMLLNHGANPHVKSQAAGTNYSLLDNVSPVDILNTVLQDINFNAIHPNGPEVYRTLKLIMDVAETPSLDESPRPRLTL